MCKISFADSSAFGCIIIFLMVFIPEPLEEDRLLLQNAEWERKLTKEQYYVTREHGTEMVGL